MNLQDERTKGIIASVVIVASILFCYIQVKSRLSPAAPASTTAAGNTAPGAAKTAPPPGSPATSGGPPAATTAATAPGSTVAQAPGGLLPSGPFKIVVRDPFVTTPAYQREIAKGDREKNDETLAPPIQTQSSLPHPKINLTPEGGSVALPSVPSDSMKKLAPLPNMNTERPSQTQNAGNAVPPSASSPAGPGPAVVPPKPEASFALTGTVEGDVPMAILRSKERSYLVREGDWLEGDFQVRRISPKQVVLRDRSGHSRILNLGVVTDAT
jgi:hypothetical protein